MKTLTRVRRHPLSELRLALIGTGGQAGGDVPSLASHPAVKIVAVCDPDQKNRDSFANRYNVPPSARFADYHTLFATMWDSLDAAYIATPDHMHAAIGLAAISKGLHVYQQKPLARSVAECRALSKAASRIEGLATQMGIQIHGESAYRTAVKWLRGGVIGKVREVYSFCAKGWGGAQPPHAPDPVPPSLDWEQYCGVSSTVPYVNGYFHPGNWRKWQAFGTGTLGDMACHILDPVFGGVNPGAPIRVVSHLEAPPNKDNFPYNAHIEWKFPSGLTLHWHHGDARPPEDTLFGNDLPGSGSVLIGDNGRMLVPHWATPKVFDKSGKIIEKLPPVEPSISHYHEWVDVAIGRKDGPCGADFAYAAPLTECVLLGNIASWQPTKVLTWSSPKCQFVGDGAEAANKLLLPAYRQGTTIPFING